nr:CPBP family intramembrane glutamic endopeptidase [Polyangium spumosum]
MQVYATLGDPAAEGRHLVGGVVFVVAALEELVWRGLVQRVLLSPFGWLRAWLLQAALFGVAHLPTMFLLGDPRVGPNPLLVAAGVAYSLVWGRLAMRMDRLPPAMFAHALFTWGVFEFPIWRP